MMSNVLFLYQAGVKIKFGFHKNLIDLWINPGLNMELYMEMQNTGRNMETRSAPKVACIGIQAWV